jgi:hypothetical protein
VVPVRQQAQHRRVIDRSDGSQPGVAQRDDCCGTRIVRVRFVGLTRVQEPHPRRERRRHIHDAFAGRDELLRQERAEAAGRFDRPGPRLEPGRELQQAVALPTIRVDARLADECFGVVEHRRRVGPLVRIDSDHEHHFLLQPDRRGMPRRAVLMKGDCSPLSSHAAARTQPAATSLRSQPMVVAGHH